MWHLLIIINIVLLIILFGGYCILIAGYHKWFLRLKAFEPSGIHKPLTRFSVIIAARNEENNIANCLQSILQNNYPPSLFEIIVADDFSTDKTPESVESFYKEYSNVRLVRLQDKIGYKINSYKKKAIETAIEESRFEWIVTTDADCIVNTEWLSLLDAYIQKTHSLFVAAPVMFLSTNNFLGIFQSLDFISLQGITAASVSAGVHSMCNGANLAYEKNTFYSVKGFAGIDNIASGDDMLLMQKIKKIFPNNIGYLFHPGAVVTTLPEKTWKSFIYQRIRWASKATSYKERNLFWVLLLVYLFNLYLVVLGLAAIFYPRLFFFWLALLAGKIICELPFMYDVAKFFKRKQLLWWFPLMQPFHIVYSVVAGFWGKFGKYKWKGRTVK